MDFSFGHCQVCGRGMSRDYKKMSKGCLSKKRVSEELADKLAKKWDQSKYYCKICSGWHLTSGKKKEAQVVK